MGEDQTKQVHCQICNKLADLDEAWPAELIRPGILETIRKKYPNWDDQGYICLEDLNHFREDYVEDVLEEEMGQISKLHEEVLESLKQHEILSKNINLEFEQDLTFWEHMSDRLADVGGSWRFIFAFAIVLALWIALNTVALRVPFDPFPYILLNLVLSCLAAIQAPIIMMSQNRQDAKDRLRSEHDYQLNLKAELEIRHLNEKMDLLLSTQWRRLLEIQRIQMEVLQELVRHTKQRNN